MRSIRSQLALAITATCAMMAAPVHAQRVADLAPRAASYVAPTSTASRPILAASRDLAPALRPSSIDAPDALAPRRLSTAGHAAAGAAAGAGAGVLASLAMFAFEPDCRRGESMCGLAIPVFIGGGALTGSVVGLVVGLIRNR